MNVVVGGIFSSDYVRHPNLGSHHQSYDRAPARLLQRLAYKTHIFPFVLQEMNPLLTTNSLCVRTLIIYVNVSRGVGSRR